MLLTEDEEHGLVQCVTFYSYMYICGNSNIPPDDERYIHVYILELLALKLTVRKKGM